MSIEKFYETREELIAHFGALTIVPATVLGVWVHEGVRYEDELRRFIVDVEDTPENQVFFAQYKPRLLERFEQIDIYIASYPVDIV